MFFFQFLRPKLRIKSFADIQAENTETDRYSLIPLASIIKTLHFCKCYIKIIKSIINILKSILNEIICFI